MQNELKYQVRSREIVDLVSAMRSTRLTLSPYFQRNLVWREAHKRDFIDTILKGYPFPQIFLARGPIDLETMTASQCVVDGQQRLNTIRDFVTGQLEAGGRLFRDLSAKEKEDFLKYEVAVIDFDLDAGDPRLKEVFHRLNRTYYSLSAIEKIASEYSASEFLLVARVLCGEITKLDESEDELDDVDIELDEQQPENRFSRDPGIDAETWRWMLDHADGAHARLINSRGIFTGLEFDRKVPLMFTLNIMCTYLSGYFNRNDKVRKYLEDKNSSFPEREEVIAKLNDAADLVAKLEIDDGSMWWNKANFFTLMCELVRDQELRSVDAELLKQRLTSFSFVVPADYALAAREAIGRKRERELRATTFRKIALGQ
ncbi:DUF262 domain-containing protein [Neorhizobium galegae]|uniref:DUF262 domain-containing protein n=1 Tax=Neorhizobium galegae TaxID=399 RepID=UPI00210357C7|nr:DUF262 domain-containing protein [Neorhizobium galegae]MCQ1855312.1 DUF262 domain-containing protein [Neorhizobium galegae]